MKYLPLIRAAIRRRPVSFVLLFLSSLFAYALLGLAVEGGDSLKATPLGGVQLDEVVAAISLGGLGLILFLTWNAISQSVRARRKELSVLKALGFAPFLILALVWAEAALPCLAGAAAGMALAHLMVREILNLLPRGDQLPLPHLSASLFAAAVMSALGVSLAGATLPVSGILRRNLARTLAEES